MAREETAADPVLEMVGVDEIAPEVGGLNMTVIIYGEHNEVFETEERSVPRAIIELYNFCGGRMGRELFARVIDGLTTTGTIEDMATIFGHNSCEDPIKKIYTYSDCYYKLED